MSLQINGINMDSVSVDGIKQDRFFVNGVNVFEDSITLHIPNGATKTNLRALIDAQAGGKDKVIIINDGVVSSVVTGDLSGLDVTLINNGEMQGVRIEAAGSSHMGLRITSPITLINKGWIRGRGGVGGTGAKGQDLSKAEQLIEERSNTHFAGTLPESGWTYRSVANTSNPFYVIAWDNVKKTLPSTNYNYAGPTSIPGITGVFKRGAKQYEGGGKYFYKIIRETTIYTTITGGAGGLGGIGQAFEGPAQPGSAGSPSTPAGGNNGGTGGKGGTWGQSGVRPSGGSIGGSPGNSVVGTSFIKNSDSWNNGGNLSGPAIV